MVCVKNESVNYELGSKIGLGTCLGKCVCKNKSDNAKVGKKVKDVNAML